MGFFRNQHASAPLGQSSARSRFVPALTGLLGLAGILLALRLLALLMGELGYLMPSSAHVKAAKETRVLPQGEVAGRELLTADGLANPPAGSVVIEMPALISPAAEQASSSVIPYVTDVALPDAIILENVPVGRQARNLSCELQAASDLAWYYGKPYTWEEIFMLVGYSPEGDPHRGFVGRNLNDQPGNVYPYGYGVYAEPIARALQQIGLPAYVHYGESSTWLRAQVAAGNPVMIWAVGGMRVAELQEWLTTDGVVVHGVPYEHTYLVLGYDAHQVWVQDPWDGKRRAFAWEQFVASWDVLGRMAVVIDPNRPAADGDALSQDMQLSSAEE